MSPWSWLICGALGFGLVALAFVRGASRNERRARDSERRTLRDRKLLASHIAANSDSERVR